MFKGVFITRKVTKKNGYIAMWGNKKVVLVGGMWFWRVLDVWVWVAV